MAADGPGQNEASIQTTTTELASENVEVVKTKVDSKTPVEVKIDADQANTMVFGKHIFTNGSLNLYEVSKDYIPNDSYILGPGDVVTVSIFEVNRQIYNLPSSQMGLLSRPTFLRFI